jgi:hypothetical protein
MRRLLLLLPLSCSGEPPSPPAADCAEHSWQSTGRPILLTWCMPCHSSALPEPLRQGAPLGVDFDTYARTAPWAERIVVRATGEAPSMPPGGGVPEAQQQALADWISCGMPGGTELPDDPCAAPEPLPGDLRSADSPCAPGLGLAVGGSLSVEGPADLACVCSVEGDLRLGADAHLPRLLRVGGTVLLEEGVLEGATEVLLPLLSESGPLLLRGPSPLVRLELPVLATVHGPAHVSGLDLATIPLGGLRRVEGDLTVEDVASSTLDLARLEEVQGELVLRRMPGLVELRGTLGLQRVTGSMLLEDLPALAALDRFSALTELGGSVTLRRVRASSFTAFDRIVSVPGDVWLEDLHGVSESIAFPDLEAVGGSLVLLRSDALASWDGLPWLRSVGGDLHFEGNLALAALPPWGELATVGGDLRFVDNPSLPTSSIEALADRLLVSGQVIVSGNAP